MTDHELYMHIFEYYKPEKNTAIFFDLSNYYLCGLQPRILYSNQELIFNCLDAEKNDLYAFVDNFTGDLRILFSYKEFYVFRHLYNQYNHDFDLKIEIDIAPYRKQIEADLENLVNFLKKTQRS